jgi:hypothetical protein
MIHEIDRRIIEKPSYTSWHNGQFRDSIKNEGQIDYEGLSDLQKLFLYIYAWNKSYISPSKKGILKKFGWTNYRLQKLIKKSNGLITTGPTFSDETGLLTGSGYRTYLN